MFGKFMVAEQSRLRKVAGTGRGERAFWSKARLGPGGGQEGPPLPSLFPREVSPKGVLRCVRTGALEN